MKTLITLILIALAAYFIYKWLTRDATLPEPGPLLPKPGSQPPVSQDLDKGVRSDVTLEKRNSDDRSD